MKALNVAVIGVGHLGQHHARIYSQMEGARLTGLVECDEQRGRIIARRCGTDWYPSVQALLEQTGVPDAASVVVPTCSHFAVAEQLLRRGVSLLVEKPVTATVEEARELNRLAKERGLVVAVGHVEQFNSAMMYLRSHLEGVPRFVRASRQGLYTNRIADVGVVLDLMIHDLELARYLFGGCPVGLTASTLTERSSHEDLAAAQLMFSNGAVAHLMASRISHRKNRTLEVITDRATYTLDLIAQTIRVYRAELDPITGQQMEVVSEPVLERGEPLKLELESFLQAVRTKSRPVVSLEDGAAALELALTVLEKAR